MPVLSRNIQFVKGRFGKGVLIDGNGYLQYSAENILNWEKGTIEMWVKSNWDGKELVRYAYFFDAEAGTGGQKNRIYAQAKNSFRICWSEEIKGKYCSLYRGG